MALIYYFSENEYEVYETYDSQEVIILSPKIYWYKKCNIPTKNISKAKKIAIHMLSDKPKNFSEIVLYKNANHYDAYAYDMVFVKKIIHEHKYKNPKIYFANQLALDENISIDSKKMLCNFNGTMIEVAYDTSAAKNISEIYLELLENQKYLLGFEKNNQKTLKFYTSILGLYILIVLFYFIGKIQTNNIISNKIEELDSNSKSAYEIKSLIKKYSKLEKNSNKLKQDIYEEFKKQNINTLKFEKNTVTIVQDKN